ncbi:MAG: adenylate/guanylate cyclase domain-containing protein, partial [Saprospiraceae bacterium]|nr:adenylate/guanylate cyclase domain-containing protein [Saprospiraceae bacterium]
MVNSSTSRQDRKLVAILFADIQGYTAMMQSDESNAMSRLKRYQEVLNECVSNNQGEVIKNYGDGSLCLFSSVLDALNCAKSVQESLTLEPKVPLRIGLHLGDVTHSQGDVYGNDINIASRIESLGVAGSVLMSGEFLNKVKNQSEFKFQSLGRFHFKNVEEKIEVIALANDGFTIPAKSEMAGKLRRTSSPLRKNLALILSLVLLFLAYWYIIKPGVLGNIGADTLTKAEREKRVTISVFENSTGMDDLDNFGALISDWLTSMLRETGEANVISQENLQLNLAGIGSQSSDQLLADRGVGLHITGKIHFLDGQLVLMPKIIDTRTGEAIHTPSNIKGSPLNKEDLLEDLTQNILGYWKVRDKKRYLQKPPRYEAYQEYLKGNEIFYEQSAEAHFKKAYNLDTTFFSPLFRLIPFYWNFRRFDAQDSLYRFLDLKKSNFTRWETLIYQFMKTRDEGQRFEAAQFAIEAAEMDPSHYLSFNRAAKLFYRNNYPQRAIEVLKSIDTILLSKEEVRQIKQMICHVTILEHDYEKAIEMSQEILATRKLVSYEPENYVDALIYARQFDKMHAYIQNLERSPTAPWLYRICNALKVVGEDSLLQFYAED